MMHRNFEGGDRSFASSLSSLPQIPQQTSKTDNGSYMNIPQYNPQDMYQSNDKAFFINDTPTQSLNLNPGALQRESAGVDNRRLSSIESGQTKPAPRPRAPKSRPNPNSPFQGPPQQNSYSGNDFSDNQPSRSSVSSNVQQRPGYPETDKQLDMDVEVSEYNIVFQVSYLVFACRLLNVSPLFQYLFYDGINAFMSRPGST